MALSTGTSSPRLFELSSLSEKPFSSADTTQQPAAVHPRQRVTQSKPPESERSLPIDPSHVPSDSCPAEARELLQPNEQDQKTTDKATAEKRAKIRAKNEKKHQRQKERKAQEHRDRCLAFLRLRRLDALADDLVAMGFPKERSTWALICCDGKVEDAVAWLVEGGNANAKDLSGATSVNVDLSKELQRMEGMEAAWGAARVDVERAVIVCEGDLSRAEAVLRAAQSHVETPEALPQSRVASWAAVAQGRLPHGPPTSGRQAEASSPAGNGVLLPRLPPDVPLPEAPTQSPRPVATAVNEVQQMPQEAAGQLAQPQKQPSCAGMEVAAMQSAAWATPAAGPVAPAATQVAAETHTAEATAAAAKTGGGTSAGPTHASEVTRKVCRGTEPGSGSSEGSDTLGDRAASVPPARAYWEGSPARHTDAGAIQAQGAHPAASLRMQQQQQQQQHVAAMPPLPALGQQHLHPFAVPLQLTQGALSAASLPASLSSAAGHGAGGTGTQQQKCPEAWGGLWGLQNPAAPPLVPFAPWMAPSPHLGPSPGQGLAAPTHGPLQLRPQLASLQPSLQPLLADSLTGSACVPPGLGRPASLGRCTAPSAAAAPEAAALVACLQLPDAAAASAAPNRGWCPPLVPSPLQVPPSDAAPPEDDPLLAQLPSSPLLWAADSPRPAADSAALQRDSSAPASVFSGSSRSSPEALSFSSGSSAAPPLQAAAGHVSAAAWSQAQWRQAEEEGLRGGRGLEGAGGWEAWRDSATVADLLQKLHLQGQQRGAALLPQGAPLHQQEHTAFAHKAFPPAYSLAAFAGSGGVAAGRECGGLLLEPCRAPGKAEAWPGKVPVGSGVAWSSEVAAASARHQAGRAVGAFGDPFTRLSCESPWAPAASALCSTPLASAAVTQAALHAHSPFNQRALVHNGDRPVNWGLQQPGYAYQLGGGMQP